MPLCCFKYFLVSIKEKLRICSQKRTFNRKKLPPKANKKNERSNVEQLIDI